MSYTNKTFEINNTPMKGDRSELVIDARVTVSIPVSSEEQAQDIINQFCFVIPLYMERLFDIKESATWVDVEEVYLNG